MTSLATDESSAVSVPAVSGRYRTAVTAVLAGVAYLLAAELGMTLTMRPQPISTLWPPNAILFGLLLLTPQRRWWVILLGAFPAHLLVELWSGIPLPMILCWFLSNASEALIGASVVLVLGGGPARFDTFRGVGIFLLAAPTSVFISCFLDAGFVQLNGWGSTGYWHNWSVRFLSNLLAQLTFVPLIVTWGEAGRRGLRRLWGSRAIEPAVLAVMLTLVCLLVFTRAGPSTNTSPALLYAPLPLLLWAAVRFGPAATSASLLLVALLAVAGAVAGKGPFAGDTPAANVLAMQSFLIVVAIPLMTLSAITRERAAAEERARASEKRLQLALDAARMGTWEWEVGTGRGVWSDTSAAIFGVPSAGDGGLARFSISSSRRIALRSRLPSTAPRPGARRTTSSSGSGISTARCGGSTPRRPPLRTRRDGHPLVGVNVDITDREMAYATVNEWKNRYEAAIHRATSCCTTGTRIAMMCAMGETSSGSSGTPRRNGWRSGRLAQEGVSRRPLEVSPIAHIIAIRVPVVQQLVARSDRGLVAVFPFIHRGVSHLTVGDVNVDADQPGGPFPSRPARAAALWRGSTAPSRRDAGSGTGRRTACPGSGAVKRQ